MQTHNAHSKANIEDDNEEKLMMNMLSIWEPHHPCNKVLQIILEQ